MGFALGVLFIWLGAACLWVATHGTEAKTPWEAYEQVLGALRQDEEDLAAGALGKAGQP